MLRHGGWGWGCNTKHCLESITKSMQSVWQIYKPSAYRVRRGIASHIIKSTIRGGEWSASRSGRFTLKTHCSLDGPQTRGGRLGEELPGFEPAISQTVTSHYTLLPITTRAYRERENTNSKVKPILNLAQDRGEYQAVVKTMMIDGCCEVDTSFLDCWLLKKDYTAWGSLSRRK